MEKLILTASNLHENLTDHDGEKWTSLDLMYMGQETTIDNVKRYQQRTAYVLKQVHSQAKTDHCVRMLKEGTGKASATGRDLGLLLAEHAKAHPPTEDDGRLTAIPYIPTLPETLPDPAAGVNWELSNSKNDKAALTHNNKLAKLVWVMWKDYASSDGFYKDYAKKDVFQSIPDEFMEWYWKEVCGGKAIKKSKKTVREATEEVVWKFLEERQVELDKKSQSKKRKK